MNIMLVGAGTVTAGLVQKLMEQGHTIAAMLGQLTPSQLEIHNYSGVVVISPETTTSTETLTKAAEIGKLIYVIAGASDSISGWAATTRVPTFAYPPSQTDVDNLLMELRRGDAGATRADDQYRRVVLGGDVAARGGDKTIDNQAGNSSGAHLHYGIKKRTGPDTYVWVDPADYFDITSLTPWGCSD